LNFNLIPERFLRAGFTLVLLVAGFLAVSQSAWGQSVWAQVELTESDNPFAPILRINTSFYQVRVDQRVIVRLPSQPSPAAASAQKNNSAAVVRYKEQKIGKCLWIDKLAGSRIGTKESLELLTRDGVLIRAYLGDGCLAREFYAGAYMERPYDGKLCVDRDLLHARTGAKCEVDRFRLLIPR
jgi:hypothetical protein